MRGPRSTRSPTNTPVRVRVGAIDEFVAEHAEQLLELVGAAVDVADDVEGAVLSLLVVPKRSARDRRSLHVLRRVEDVDLTEALPLQTAETAL